MIEGSIRIPLVLDDTFSQRLARVEHLLSIVYSGVNDMTTALEALRAQVDRNAAVDASAIALLTGLSEQLRQLAQDPAAILDLAEQIRDSSDALAQAVIANTPAAPEPAPVPEQPGPPADEVQPV